MAWSFRPRWWAVLLTVALSALMSSLGVWQLNRGHEKEALLARYAAAAQQAPQPLATQGAASIDAIGRVQVSGHYQAAQQLLLDNQGLDGRPGFHVWSALRDDSGRLVIVDRGWIPRDQGLARQGIGVGDAPRSVIGYWHVLPRLGLRLQVDNCVDVPWPRVVQYPTLEDLQCLYGEPVAPGLLLLDAEAADGFARNWAGAPELNPAKHYGYAAQWFAFTATLIAIFFKLNLRRRP